MIINQSKTLYREIKSRNLLLAFRGLPLQSFDHVFSSIYGHPSESTSILLDQIKKVSHLKQDMNSVSDQDSIARHIGTPVGLHQLYFILM